MTSLKGIESAPNIRILILNNSLIKDFSSLKYLANLLYLDISSSNLHNYSEKHFEKCHVLQYLDFSKNSFRSFPELPNTLLYEVQANRNEITQLGRMNWLFNLRILNLADNHVVDLMPFAMCPFLRVLDLSNNQLRGEYQ